MRDHFLAFTEVLEKIRPKFAREIGSARAGEHNGKSAVIRESIVLPR